MPVYTPFSAYDYWLTAVEASRSERERMWREAQEHQLSWRIALLQSLPDYHRYDPAAARRTLRRTLGEPAPADVRTVTRLRLAEMDRAAECRAAVDVLQRRLADIIAIEKRFEDDGR